MVFCRVRNLRVESYCKKKDFKQMICLLNLCTVVVVVVVVVSKALLMSFSFNDIKTTKSSVPSVNLYNSKIWFDSILSSKVSRCESQSSICVDMTISINISIEKRKMSTGHPFVPTSQWISCCDCEVGRTVVVPVIVRAFRIVFELVCGKTSVNRATS